MDIVASGDFCTGGNHATKSGENQNGAYTNDGFLQSEKNYDLDYKYEGYTLEIGDKVRILQIFDNAKEETNNQIVVKGLSDEGRAETPTTKSLNKKPKRRVQFWGYDREWFADILKNQNIIYWVICNYKCHQTRFKDNLFLIFSGYSYLC